MLSNTEIAAVLQEIADLLDIAGENPFKVRGFRRAVEVIGGLPEEAAEVVGQGRLRDLPGIGETLAEVITELVTTGNSSYRHHLTDQVPASLLELLRIPGLGPRKASQLYRELGITTLSELEAAARAGQLRSLPGFGAKTEEKLLQGLELVRTGQSRWRLGEALPVAEGLLARLQEQPAVLAAEIGGSARRRRETVGDLDLLATSTDPAVVCRWFATQGGLTVEVAGDTKVSGRTAAGLQVDLRVVPPPSYGAALCYFTGSREHNIRLRERAQRQGLTLNEYGLFRGDPQDRGELLAGATEAELYGALGLAYIPPELREDRGELEAAATGRLPRLLALEDLRGDLHLHTTASDGRLSLPEMAAAARQRGYAYMGLTDHSESLYVAHGQTPERLREALAAVREYNAQERGFTVLAGIEADILSDGRLDVPEALFPELDFVIGSIHQGFSSDADRMTARVVAAMASGRMDIFGHPTGRLVLQRAPYALHLEEVLAAAREYEVALEVNANPHRLDLSDVHCRRAVEAGCKLVINTDAHGREELGLMRYGVMTARRGWVEAPQVLNAWPLAELQAWLRRRRAGLGKGS